MITTVEIEKPFLGGSVNTYSDVQEAFNEIDRYLASDGCSSADRVTLAINKANLSVNFSMSEDLKDIRRNIEYMLNQMHTMASRI